jgi:hypothetical protein
VQQARTLTSTIVFRLTALWALAESGLGGWMHALKLPFTGFFVGGFAIIIISLIARFGSPKDVVKATIIVLLIKAAVSPHSPPPAYLAVAFQGFLGALLYRVLPFSIASVFLGIIAMVESALQMLIIATIIYGKSLWQAIDSFFKGLVREFHLPADLSFSFWIIIAYTAIYATWGLILGIWMIRLPQQIERKANTIGIVVTEKTVMDQKTRRKGTVSKIFTYLIVLTAILLIFLFDKSTMGKATYVVIRTFAVLAFLIWVVNPVFKWLMQFWLKRSRGKVNRSVEEIISTLPELRGYLKPAFARAKEKHTGLARYKEFVLIMIVLTLYPGKSSSHET